MKYFIVVFDSSGNLLDFSPSFEYFGFTDACTALRSYLLDTPNAYEGYAYLRRGSFDVDILIHYFFSEIVGYEK